ncbi:MAG: hypothetical protein AABW80_04160 [Nanoarchaeota archaeon]
MGFGDLFSKSWKEYKGNFKPIFFLMLIFVGIPLTVVNIYGARFFIENRDLLLSLQNAEGSVVAGQLFSSSPELVFALLALSVISILLLIFVQAGLIEVGMKKEKYSFKEIISGAKGKYWKFLGFIIVLAIFLVLLTILLIIPAIIFLVYWIFATYILFEGKKGIIGSLKESFALVRGKWWKVFGYSLLLLVIIIAVNFVFGLIALPASLDSGFDPIEFSEGSFKLGVVLSIISKFLGNLFAIPFSIIFYKNFYFSLRKKK